MGDRVDLAEFRRKKRDRKAKDGRIVTKEVRTEDMLVMLTAVILERPELLAQYAGELAKLNPKLVVSEPTHDAATDRMNKRGFHQVLLKHGVLDGESNPE